MTKQNIFQLDNPDDYFESNPQAKEFYVKNSKGQFIIKGKKIAGSDTKFLESLINEYKSRNLDDTQLFIELQMHLSKQNAKKKSIKLQAKAGQKLAEEIHHISSDDNISLDVENTNGDETYPRLLLDGNTFDTYYVKLVKISIRDFLNADDDDDSPVETPVKNKIANFIMKINHRSIDIETNKTYINLTLNNGFRELTVDIEPDKLGSLSIAERNLFSSDFIFSGQPSEYKFFAEKTISEAKVGENYLVSQAGMHKNPNAPNEFMWVASNGAFDRNGNIIENVKLLKGDDITRCELIPHNWERRVDVNVFYQFNKSSIVIPYLAFTVATLFKQRFYNALYEKSFPILWSVGKAESGKSSTVKIIKNILKMKHENNLNMLQLSPFALTSHLDKSRNLPIILDENKPNKEEEKNKWLRLVNTVYNSDVITKGQKDLSTIEFRTDASVISLGEFTYGDTSTLDRCIIVDANRDLQTTEAHLAGYRAMIKSDHGWVGETMLWDALNISDEEILSLYNEIRELLFEAYPDVRDRTLHNYSLLGFALHRLGTLCGVDESIEKSLKVIMNLMEGDIEDVQDDMSVKDGLAGKMLRDIWEMHKIVNPNDSTPKYIYAEHITEDVHYRIFEKENTIAFHLPSIMPIYQAWCRTHNYSNNITTKDLYKQIKHHPHYEGHNIQIKLGGYNTKCLVMKLDFFSDSISAIKIRK
jgi:hypothetical protein